MYDALSISVKQPQGDFLIWLSSIGIEPRIKGTRKQVEEYSIRLKNLTLKHRSDWLNISGSISGYTQGHNITPLPFSKIQPAIESLSNDLDFDISSGRVTSYEIANSFPVVHHIGSYLDMMKLWKGKEPVYENNGTLKFGSSTQLVFYDKIAEVIQRGNTVPEAFTLNNWLRYELKRLRGLERRVKGIVKPLGVPELYSEDMVSQVVIDYGKGYDAVQKVKVKNGVKMIELDRQVRDFVKGYMST